MDAVDKFLLTLSYSLAGSALLCPLLHGHNGGVAEIRGQRLLHRAHGLYHDTGGPEAPHVAEYDNFRQVSD